MSESENTPTRQLVSPRNLILAAVAVCVLSVVAMCISMLRPSDSGGMASDSFGTRRNGYRALFEVLSESGIPITRAIAPPAAADDGPRTYVFLSPNARLVGYAPKYLHGIRNWVERGGRIVVAPATSSPLADARFAGMGDVELRDILQILQVDHRVTVGEAFDADSEPLALNQRPANDLWQFDLPTEPPPRLLPASMGGSLQPLADKIEQVAVPGDKFATFGSKGGPLDGSLSVRDAAGDEHLLIAVLNRGAGQIILVSEPRLFSNVLLAKADNSVLAAHLLAPDGREVIFDEFYHGLAVRGNPFYLLTRPGFAAVTIGILLFVGAATWRQAVFLGPPLERAGLSRRDIGEYVDAMGAFFSRGRGHRRFLVREVRDGVLQQLCQEMKLPPDTHDVRLIESALARRNPRRAESFRRAIDEIDTYLAESADYPASRFLPNLTALASVLHSAQPDISVTPTGKARGRGNALMSVQSLG
jgi:hypothetical protein